MELKAASLDAAAAAEAAAAAAAHGDGAYVTPELLMRAVQDISARRRTSSAADITMYLQRRFPMRHADRRLLKEVERKLHIATQHGLFVHTGYSYRLPAERLGKALSSRDLSTFWTHYHRLERDCSSDTTSTESEGEGKGGQRPAGGQQRGESSQAAPRRPPPAAPPPPPAQRRRRRRVRALRRIAAPAPARCRCRCHTCSRCCGRSASEDSRGGGRRRRSTAGGPRRYPRRHGRPSLAATKCRRRRQRRPPSRARALVRCDSTPINHHQPPDELPQEAGGPSNSLLMYLVLQLPPESDEGSESS